MDGWKTTSLLGGANYVKLRGCVFLMCQEIMDLEKKRVFPKMVGFPPKSSNHPFVSRGFSMIFTIHFGVFPPIFGSTPK